MKAADVLRHAWGGRQQIPVPQPGMLEHTEHRT